MNWSTIGMLVLIVEYLAIALCSAFEWNWSRCLYFVSAAGISVAVIWMGYGHAIDP
jgi:hypothetical protein